MAASYFHRLFRIVATEFVIAKAGINLDHIDNTIILKVNVLESLTIQMM